MKDSKLALLIEKAELHERAAIQKQQEWWEYREAVTKWLSDTAAALEDTMKARILFATMVSNSLRSERSYMREVNNHARIAYKTTLKIHKQLEKEEIRGQAIKYGL